MREFNNDKLWLAFEASGCVGDYLNYRVSKITTTQNIDKTQKKDCFNGFKNDRNCNQTTQSW